MAVIEFVDLSLHERELVEDFSGEIE